MIFLIRQELANLPKVELIQNDGSPARKLFILWNPILRQETVGALLPSWPRKTMTISFCKYWLCYFIKVSNETNSTVYTRKSAEGSAKVRSSR